MVIQQESAQVTPETISSADSDRRQRFNLPRIKKKKGMKQKKNTSLLDIERLHMPPTLSQN